VKPSTSTFLKAMSVFTASTRLSGSANRGSDGKLRASGSDLRPAVRFHDRHPAVIGPSFDSRFDRVTFPLPHKAWKTLPNLYTFRGIGKGFASQRESFRASI